MCPRSPLPPSRGSSRKASSSATTPIGTFTRKIHRQPVSSPASARITPPATGPIAVEMPTVAPKKPNARPRSVPRNNCWISAEFCGAIAPADNPWASRAAISHPMLGAAPANALNSTNPASASMNSRRRPNASPSRPAGTRVSPKASA
jgi:hypothetical protein